MPSIFDDFVLSAYIRRLQCPPFDENTVKAAWEAQERALTERHRAEMERARPDVEQYVRDRVSRDLRDSLWNVSWVRVPAAPLLRADPSTLSLEVQLELVMIAPLPPELTDRVEEAPLLGSDKLALARGFAEKLDEYNTRVQRLTDESPTLAEIANRQKYEASELRERLKAGVERWKKSQQPSLPFGVSSSSQPLFVIPSSTFNSLSSQPRYFRILVWNLENFTRDRRPKGTQPMDSMRNAARIAIVADVLARFGVDLLLMMETGTDAGTATTRIAKRVAAKLNENDGRWEPLVSPPTGALPEVMTSYPNLGLGRPSGIKAVALRTLFEVYVVTPRYAGVPAQVTAGQIADAWTVLCGASSAASRHLPRFQVTADNAMAKEAPSYEILGLLAKRIHATAQQVGDTMGGELQMDVDTVQRLLFDVVSELGSGALQTTMGELAYLILSARDAVGALYDLHPEQAFQQNIIDEGIACLQAVEVMTLFLIKTALGEIPQDRLSGNVFRSDSSPNGLIPLAAFLCTGAQRVTMTAIDRKAGPMNGELDNDVLLDALQRVGAVERHIETYGIVYRQPVDGALEVLLDRGVRSHGFSGGVDEEAARYDIIRAPLSRSGFSIQQAGGLLNWRSALQITVPASKSLLLPLVVYHTRYSGTAQIRTMERDLTAADNTILARCQSVEMIAGAVLPGAPSLGPPLILGDFNVPGLYLNMEPTPVSKAKNVQQAYTNRSQVRAGFFAGMAARGYLRHSIGGKPGDGYPPTTLKAFSSITRGDDPGSEPYDGTYQPFDYVLGKASVSSGVVLVAGLLDDRVLGEKVSGLPSEATSGGIIDPDAGENEDEDQEAQDVDLGNEPAPVDWTVGQALAVEVGRVYRGILRRIHREIEGISDWIANLGARSPSENLVALMMEIIEVRDSFDKAVGPRIEWFVQGCVNGATDTWFKAKGSDVVVDWQKLFNAAAVMGKRENITTRSLTNLPDLAGEVMRQLTALETDLTMRRLVAYRAVVSDHLPQIVEIDMQA